MVTIFFDLDSNLTNFMTTYQQILLNLQNNLLLTCIFAMSIVCFLDSQTSAARRIKLGFKATRSNGPASEYCLLISVKVKYTYIKFSLASRIIQKKVDMKLSEVLMMVALIIIGNLFQGILVPMSRLP